MRRTVIRWAIVLGSLLLWLLLSGCGIETFILLNPPSAVAYAVDERFRFRATSDNDEVSFVGFEVYYRIYQVGDTIDVDYETYDELIAAGFRRMNKATDTPGTVSKPLIYPNAVDRGTDYLVTIDFSISIPKLDYPTAKITEAAVPISHTNVRRGVADGSIDFKDFYRDEFGVGDTDASAGAIEDIAGGLSVTVVCFALSWGWDESRGLEVYSQPVWLGNGTFTFPY